MPKSGACLLRAIGRVRGSGAAAAVVGQPRQLGIHSGRGASEGFHGGLQTQGDPAGGQGEGGREGAVRHKHLAACCLAACSACRAMRVRLWAQGAMRTSSGSQSVGGDCAEQWRSLRASRAYQSFFLCVRNLQTGRGALQRWELNRSALQRCARTFAGASSCAGRGVRRNRVHWRGDQAQEHLLPPAVPPAWRRMSARLRCINSRSDLCQRALGPLCRQCRSHAYVIL